jgi:lactate dehydrogenase-like 2-hydroxyacid dehydrogenase
MMAEAGGWPGGTGATPVLLQLGAMAPDVQAALDAEFRCLDLDAFERDPDSAARIRGLVMRSNQQLSDALLARLPNLEIIATFGVGYDGVPLDVAAGRAIVVANTPGVLNAAVAELCIGALLALLRRLPQADAFVRAGRWPQGAFPLGASLAGKRVGIVGLGGIGKDVARRLEPFGVQMAYHGRSDQRLAWRFQVDLTALAGESDILIVTAPGGAQTRRMIDAGVLRALGPQGVLVNVARGSLVDQDALVEALVQGHIGGAALDVFDDEPNVDARLFAFENVVLLPHIGSATAETRAAMGALMLDNLRTWFREGRAVTPVDIG